MSTAPFPGAYASTVGDMVVSHLGSIGTLALPAGRNASVDRGQGIEKLGHAVDHLISSSMFYTDESFAKADSEAIHILMRLRRSVFEERTEVTPGNRRLRQWIMGRLGGVSN
jgi:hypothetical protein